jgi:tetratricopeptide (TPR) repeat protein
VPAAPAQAGGLPEGHPPVGNEGSNPQVEMFQQQIAEIKALMAQNPDDAGLTVALGDAYFELARATMMPQQWQESAVWYEKAMTQGRDEDPNVLTDLAVVYRNLDQHERSIDLLERAIAAEEDHWQAWFNMVIVKNFDLHDHDGAREAFVRLKAIAADNPQVPDLTQIEHEVMGH